MDLILVSIGFILCIVGLIGSVLPVLPGPPLGWLGLLFLELTVAIPTNYWLLGITFVIAIGIFLLDYMMPAISTKKFGGSKAGAVGAVLGLIIGILAPIPFGILIGPFLGAFIGEIIFNKTKGPQALKSALGSFLGFLASTIMKLTISLVFLGIFIWKVLANWSGLF
tara:strand:+ start:197 stop:697 length:501 start_codon:yes stop_codon:yes gene_type:complete